MRLRLIILLLLAFLNFSGSSAQGLVGAPIEDHGFPRFENPVYPPALSKLILSLIRSGVQVPSKLLTDATFRNWLAYSLHDTDDLYLQTLLAELSVRSDRLMLDLSDDPNLNTGKFSAYARARRAFQLYLHALFRRNENSTKASEILDRTLTDPAFMQGRVNVPVPEQFKKLFGDPRVSVLGEGLTSWTYIRVGCKGKYPIHLGHFYHLPADFVEIYKHKPLAYGKP